MIIKGSSNVYFLIGNNISHSLSPQIHNFLIDYYSINSVYIPFEVQSNIASLLTSLMNVNNFYGCNITIPYKEEAYKLVEVIDRKAKSIGSINTIKKVNNSFVGINTDILGFKFSLAKDLNFTPENKNIIIFGSGGTCKTVIFSLIDKANSITIISRNNNNIKNLLKQFSTKLKWRKFLNNNKELTFPEADLIVNTTPLGLKGERIDINWEALKKTCCIFELIYVKTELIKQAKNKGLKCVNGLTMLIYQAIKSFEFWHNIKVDDNLVKKIKEEVLIEKNF